MIVIACPEMSPAVDQSRSQSFSSEVPVVLFAGGEELGVQTLAVILGEEIATGCRNELIALRLHRAHEHVVAALSF